MENEDIVKDDIDMVNHPPHYGAKDGSGLECIDFIRAALTYDEYKGYLKGNAYKYMWRAGYKGDEIEDIEKSEWYEEELKKHIRERA